MNLQFTFLLLLSTFIVTYIGYILLMILFKKEIRKKETFLRFTISAVISYLIAIIISFLYVKSNSMIENYKIPLFTILLFLLFNVVTHRSKVGLIFVFGVIGVMLFPLFYLEKENSSINSFEFIINRPAKNFELVNNKIQNTYYILLESLIEKEQDISFETVKKEIVLLEPKAVVRLKPHRTLKVKILLESTPKDIKNEIIKIRALSNESKKIHESIFTYSN